MKLAMLAPIAWRTPPRHYGPWESIASLLTEGLVARGVDVTLFATLDSVTAAALDGVCPHGYAEDAQLDGRVWEALHVSHALARSGEFELVHNHLDWLPLAFGEHARAPMVTTIHGFSGAGILPAYTRSSSAFVAISDSDRYAGLDYAATIHHGIDLRMLPYHAAAGGSLVSFGRIHPDKGTADAIEIARRAGRRLVICGIVQDERYFADADWHNYFNSLDSLLGRINPKWSYARNAVHIDLVACSTSTKFGDISQYFQQTLIKNCRLHFFKTLARLPKETILFLNGQTAILRIAHVESFHDRFARELPRAARGRIGRGDSRPLRFPSCIATCTVMRQPPIGVAGSSPSIGICAAVI